MSKLTRVERETIINFNEEGDVANVYTSSVSVCRRMTKRGFKAEELGNGPWSFELPKRNVRLPSKPPRISQENKLKSAERLKLLRNKGSV